MGFGAAAAELSGDGLAREAAASPGAHRPARARARSAVDGVTRLGDPGIDPTPRSPTSCAWASRAWRPSRCCSALDRRGVAVHSGSSCSSEALEPSPVLAAMGVDADRSLRASVGWCSTDADVDAFLAAFPDVVSGLRQLRQA